NPADEPDGVQKRGQKDDVAGAPVDEEQHTLCHSASPFGAIESRYRPAGAMGTVSRIAPLRRPVPGQVSRQRVRYLTTADGVQLAWAEAGSGPLVVKSSHWLTHLDYDWESPVWKHWTEFPTANFRPGRPRERGSGTAER